MAPAGTALRLRSGEAAERDRAYGRECKYVSFHNLFLFVVSAKRFCAPFKGNDRTGVAQVTFFLFVDPTTTCNRNVSRPVLVNRVDAISTTLMILMQARWLK